MKTTTKQNCVLCGAPITGYGNNPAPLAEGRCCDVCNATKVLPYRMQPLMMEIMMDRLPRNNQ